MSQTAASSPLIPSAFIRLVLQELTLGLARPIPDMMEGHHHVSPTSPIQDSLYHRVPLLFPTLDDAI